VPWPPGGGVDFVSRITARHLTEALGQPVVVENRPGASGTIGSAAVSRAVPDGYTLGIATSSSHPAAVVLQRSVPYDPVVGFTMVTQIGITPYVLIGGAVLPVRTLLDFFALARAQPGALSYASVGTATLGYLLTRQMEAMAGISMVHVPYRGSSLAYPDLLTGTVAVMLDNPSGSSAMVREGRMRALAVTRRSPALPETPSFAEAGLPGFEGLFWYGLVAPPGLLPEIAARIQRALAERLAAPAAREELMSRDVEPVAGTGEAFAALVAGDVAWMREAARRLDIRPEG
jgi:tripartite-type tricarboxylate transporter receptor subunit TctC